MDLIEEYCEKYGVEQGIVFEGKENKYEAHVLFEKSEVEFVVSITKVEEEKEQIFAVEFKRKRGDLSLYLCLEVQASLPRYVDDGQHKRIGHL